MAKDITSLLGGVLTQENLDSLSKASGVSRDEIKSVLDSALPSLLGGALEQANNSDTAAGFAGALSDHAKDDVTNVGAFLQKVDAKDGQKIVNHLLGGSGAVEEIADRAGVSKENTSQILSLVAPLLMSLLGQETSSQQQSGGQGVGSILGSLLGGSLLGGSSASQGGGLLSGLSGNGNPLSGLLSGLLGK